MTIEMNEDEFRAKASEFIQNCEISISELSRIGKMSRNTVTDIKNNKTSVQIITIKKLLSKINRSLQQLAPAARNLLNELTSDNITLKGHNGLSLSTRFGQALGQMNSEQFETFKERRDMLMSVFADTYSPTETEEALTILAETLVAERT